ncbi:hypothetical protein FRB93_001105 [Tulasnella sp. JGI-2019a]|nr:hypothetical protein FRB93_001105 [Tulasnella sp. JGI-2019a]
MKYGVPPPPCLGGRGPEPPAATTRLAPAREENAMEFACGRAEDRMNAPLPPAQPGSTSIWGLALDSSLSALSKWTQSWRVGRIKVVDSFDGCVLGFVACSILGPLSMGVNDALNVELDLLSLTPSCLAQTERRQRLKLVITVTLVYYKSQPQPIGTGLLTLVATVSERRDNVVLLYPKPDAIHLWAGGTSAVYCGRATSHSGGMNALAASEVWILRPVAKSDSGKEFCLSWPEDGGERVAIYAVYTVENSKVHLVQRVATGASASRTLGDAYF